MILNIIPDLTDTRIFSEGKQTTCVEFKIFSEHSYRENEILSRIEAGLPLNYIDIKFRNLTTLRSQPAQSVPLIERNSYTEVLLKCSKQVDCRLQLDSQLFSSRVVQFRSMGYCVHKVRGKSAEVLFTQRQRIFLEGHLDLLELTLIVDDFLIEMIDQSKAATFSYDDISEFIHRHNKPFIRKLKHKDADEN